jgi:hypothetical protein
LGRELVSDFLVKLGNAEHRASKPVIEHLSYHKAETNCFLPMIGDCGLGVHTRYAVLDTAPA